MKEKKQLIWFFSLFFGFYFKAQELEESIEEEADSGKISSFWFWEATMQKKIKIKIKKKNSLNY